LTAIICLSGYNLWGISELYAQEARVKGNLAEYRYGEAAAAMVAEPRVNQFVIDLQNEVNPDIVGWLTIPDIYIDYSFALPGDNSFYLKRDVYGHQSAAGSLFMDCRCAQDLSDFNTIIYGHNMKNSSMFGDLKLFADEDFFAQHAQGTLFLQDTTYDLKIFACLVVRADNALIYGPSAQQDEFFAYVKKNARVYQEPNMEENVVTLSTCAYEFDDARMVVLANISAR